MFLLFLFLISYNFGEDLIDEIQDELDQKKVIAIGQPPKPIKNPISWLTFFSGGSISLGFFFLIKKIINSMKKTTITNPSITNSPSNKVDLSQEFLNRFNENIKEKFNHEKLKNFYKVIVVHYLFGDLWAMAFLWNEKFNNDTPINNENKFQQKYAFINGLNNIIQDIFSKFNKNNNHWYLNGNNFQKFIDDNDPTQWNKSMDILKKLGYSLNTYTLNNDKSIPIHGSQILNQTSSQIINEEFKEIYTNGVENLTSIENLLAMDSVKLPSAEFLKFLNDNYWPFIESQWNKIQENFSLLHQTIESTINNPLTNDYSVEKENLYKSYTIGLESLMAYNKKNIQNQTTESLDKKVIINQISQLLSENSFDINSESKESAIINVMLDYLNFIIKQSIKNPWNNQDNDFEKNKILLEWLSKVD